MARVAVVAGCGDAAQINVRWRCCHGRGLCCLWSSGSWNGGCAAVSVDEVAVLAMVIVTGSYVTVA